MALKTNSAIVTAPPFSVSVHFKPANITGNMILWMVTNFDAHYLMFWGANAGDPVAAVSYDDGVNSGEASSGTSGISAGNWYHAGAVWASSASRSIYWNGSKTSNTTNVNPTGLNLTSVGQYYYNGTLSGSKMDGLVAELGVWNVALDDAEFTSLSKGISPLRIRPQSLVDYWPLIGNDTDENGRKGNVLSNIGSVTHSDDHPRIYR